MVKATLPFVPSPIPLRPDDQLDWNARQWRQAAQSIERVNAVLEFIAESAVFEGNGELLINSPVATANMVAGAWQRITGYQAERSGPYVNADGAHGSLKLLAGGTWLFHVSCTLGFAASGQERAAQFRLVATAGGVVLGPPFGLMSLPKNGEVGAAYCSQIIDVLPDFVGVEISLEISPDAAVTGVMFNEVSFVAVNIGAWAGAFPSGGATFRR